MFGDPELLNWVGMGYSSYGHLAKWQRKIRNGSLRRFVRRMKGHCIGNHVAEQRSGTQGLPQLFSVAVINIMTKSDSGEKIIYFSLQATVHHSEKPG